MNALPADLPADFFAKMIASENSVPQAVLDCQGSVLTSKYAEGCSGRRYPLYPQLASHAPGR